MNNRPPLVESLATPVVSNGWSNWFTQVFLSLPWKTGFNNTPTLNFGSVPAHSQTGLPVTITGVRLSDSAQVTPVSDIAGIIFTGVVSASNTVTVYAKNFTAGAITTGSLAFRIIVLQN